MDVKSEIAGKVWKMVAAVGDSVDEDDEIVILESMKMEIPVVAPKAGRIAEILVEEGESIQEDQIIARLET
ncbi:MAG: biotin/lipoyl-binding carrier protein [Minwuia sp.]|uniref:biotin/lipoyl-binding carrier protein n=1 Tax=Minwuia sp. TaxID=2493630 RepID=UPI003A851FF1